MAKPHQRVFALIMAMLFLATAIAGGAVVIWQIKKDSDSQKVTKNLTELQAANNNQEPPKEENMLQGTKLVNFTPTETIPTLQTIDTKEGTGEVVKPGATVTAHYTGALANDGVIFQSSHDTGQPIPFSLDGVIKGWTEGVPGMKVGGTRRLLIPSELAYGANPREGSGIPPNADLVFDIELISVQNP